MADDGDAAEGFLDAPSERPHREVRVSAGRLADLSTQIEFLDGEVARYRQLVETERIRHATEITELELAADSRIDDQARRFRLQTKTLHDAYRSQLAAQQIEHEEALSAQVAEHAELLAAERRRYEEMSTRQRTRHETLLESARRQSMDQFRSSSNETDVLRSKELAQAKETIDRLRREVDSASKRLRRSEDFAEAHRRENRLLHKRVETLTADFRARLDDSTAQLTAARNRLEIERRRSAATLAELLERSAAIAAEADLLRARLAATDAELATTRACEAADPFEREAELEAAIGDLRAELRRYQQQ